MQQRYNITKYFEYHLILRYNSCCNGLPHNDQRDVKLHMNF